MARRSKGPKTPFNGAEVYAINKAVNTLFKRSIFHLVAPKFVIPRMNDLYVSLIPSEVWELLTEAKRIVSETPYNYNHSVSFKVTPHVDLDITSTHWLPNPEVVPIDHKLPSVLAEFANEAEIYRAQWNNVLTTFATLNSPGVQRLTAAYYWPCVAMLIDMGGQSADGLSHATRPGTVPSHMTVPLRDTNAFVMQHTLLPKIDSDAKTSYHGNAADGVAACLAFSTNTDLKNDLWPLQE